MSKMPTPKYSYVGSWGIPVVGQTDYDALRVYTESLQAQRDKAISHLVNMLHAADELADCANLNLWDTEIALTRGFLKECGK